MDHRLFQENESFARTADGRRYADVGALDVESGGRLDAVTIAYETWGELIGRGENAILVCHALSGDSNCCSWWERIVGPGRAIDTDKYFVIGTNALGGCQGSTGPSSLAPDGRPYGSRFPFITIGDMVEVQKRLIDVLGLDRLLGVCGGSMGGMQALEWSRRYPGFVQKAWITASCAAHSPMQIGFNEAARQAILRDPAWQRGDYEPGDGPTGGLAVSRMIGHLSFLSDQAFRSKFGRELQGKREFDFSWEPEFQVESYLNYQGDKFTQRFDANSVLYLTRAIDYYQCESLCGAASKYLFTSFTSDWLYPSYQSEQMHQMALDAGCTSRHEVIDLPYGHDAFLLDGEFQGKLVREFFAD